MKKFSNGIYNGSNQKVSPYSGYGTAANIIATERTTSSSQEINAPYSLNYAHTSQGIFSNNIERKYSNSAPTIYTGHGLKQKPQFSFENPFFVSKKALSWNNRYTFVFSYATSIYEDIYDFDNGDEVDTSKGQHSYVLYGARLQSIRVPSLFNEHNSLSVCGVSSNVPILNINQPEYDSDGNPTGNINFTAFDKFWDERDKSHTDSSISMGFKPNCNITDCRTSTLCALSRIDYESDDKKNNSQENPMSKLGMQRYKLTDFIYCKDHGIVSNNYLITLRRFAHPVGDNISKTAWNKESSPDIGRMLCYIGEDNKLENILNYSFHATWKEFNSEIEEKSSEEDNPDRGILGSIVNLGNPAYRKGVAAGFMGSGNQILGMISSATGGFLSNKGTYESKAALGNYDKHHIYTPRDTIQSTHMYEGKLEFSQEFSLVFNYELRAYENINPRAGFLDLLANIQTVCYRKGHFWGGAHQVNGAPGNPGGWRKANAIIDQAWDKLGGFMNSLLTGTVDWSAVWGKISSALGSAVGMAKDVISGAADVAKSTLDGDPNTTSETGKKIAQKIHDSGFPEMMKGMLKNSLGRPAIYAFSSLLSGGAVGPWHVTIGNPRQPMMCMGNMIITDTTIQHYGVLGIDDFPTGLKVIVKLKHATPRDKTGILRMYTGGEAGGVEVITGAGNPGDVINYGVVANIEKRVSNTVISSDSGVGVEEINQGYMSSNYGMTNEYGANDQNRIKASMSDEQSEMPYKENPKTTTTQKDGKK